jgi:phospholipase C
LTRLRVLVFAIVLLAMGGILASLNGCGGSSTTPHSTGKIQHVVVIFQENRTPDNLFQGLCTANGGVPGCGTGSTQYDLAQSGTDSTGNTIQLKKTNLGVDYDPSHSHKAFNLMCDLSTAGQCQMDGADLIPVSCSTGATDCPAPDLQFGYVDPTQVQPYLTLAGQYTYADRMFQTNQGPSLPAHQFIISGTSAPTVGSNLFASENPKTDGGRPNGGCDAPVGSTIMLIDPAGSETSNLPIYPCFDHPTLTDLLEAKGDTWRYYASSGYTGGLGTALWIGPEAIQHICGSTSSGVCGGPDFTSHVILNQTQILTDINNKRLPDVSWVIPAGQASDHGGDPNGNLGPSWVATVVNAIGNSSYWANTAIFITWDDWGGWFDHVAPPQVLVNCAQWGCGYVYGFRVPLIVVSPYAKAKYISKNQHDFGSILKYIEGIFGLPLLGYADAAADDLSDCFDFNQTPLPFQTIAAPFDAQFFLNDKTPPTDPDDD